MTIGKQQNLRHAGNVLLRAFFFFGSLFAQAADSLIDINQFWQGPGNDIPLFLDETGQNTFYLNSYIPNTQSDKKIGALLIDGGLGIPLGSFELPEIIPPVSLEDSAFSTSQINYRQGDFAYKELGLGTFFQKADSSIWAYQGISRTAPVTTNYSSLGNALQNHLISYENVTENEDIIWNILYHKEDINAPVNTNDNRRRVESFHTGFSIKKKMGKISFKLNPALQFTQLNRWNNLSTHLTTWNYFSIKTQLNKKLSFLLEHEIKNLSTENEAISNNNSYQLLSPQFQFHLNRYEIQLGASILDESFYPVLSFNYLGDNWHIGLNKQIKAVIVPLNSLEFNKNNYDITSLNIVYYKSLYNVLLEVNSIQSNSDNYWAISSSMDVNLSWINFANNAGIYFNNLGDFSESPLLIQYFNRASLQVSPNIWFWKNRRFQPFAAIESIYIQYSGKYGVNPVDLPVISFAENLSPYSSFLINGEFGILVKSFKLSYRWINMPGITVQNSISPYSQSITPLRHLEVVWQFWN